MRKSVVIVIGFIYLASFFIIGFFGVKIQRYNQVTYVSDFEVSYQIGEGEIKKLTFLENTNRASLFHDYQVYDPSLELNPNVIKFFVKVLPETATYNKVTFIPPRQTSYFTFNSETQTFIIDNINQYRSINFTIRSTDGTIFEKNIIINIRPAVTPS